MTTALRTSLLAALLAVGLLAAVTLSGVGPLAASDDTPDAPPATSGELTATSPALAPPDATTPATTPNEIQPAATTPVESTPADEAAVVTEPPPGESTAADAAPLRDLTTEQQAAFDRTNSALAYLTNVKGTPLSQRVDAVNAACAKLDGAALNVALRKSCAPTIKVVKLSAVYAKRCVDFSGGGCVRTNRRLATAVDDLVDAQRAYARALRSELPAGACRKELLPHGKELRGASRFADAVRDVATAIEGGDRDTIIKAAADADEKSAKVGGDGRAAPAIVNAYRKACAL